MTSDVILTDSAAGYIKNLLAKSPHAIGFRLGVKNAGCSSKKYDPGVVEQAAADTEKFTSQGIDIYVATADLKYVAGTTVDYVKNGVNHELKYTNPNIISACGCGESFDIKLSE